MRRSVRLLREFRHVRPVFVVTLIVLLVLRAGLVPLAALGTGLVVAQASATTPEPTSWWSGALLVALVVFTVSLWLGESVLHAVWLVQATIARAVDGAVRSEVRLLLGRVAVVDVVEDPDVRDDLAHVMSTGGARGYEESIGTGTWAQLNRWFDVLNLVAAGAVLTLVSPWFALVVLALVLLQRWALLRTWQAEAEAEATGSGGLRRTAYWTELGTGAPAAKELRVFGFGPWVARRRRAEAEGYLVPRWQVHRRQLRLQLVPAVVALAGGLLAVGVPAWAAATGRITPAELASVLVAGLGLITFIGVLGGHGRDVEYGHVVLDALDRLRARLTPLEPAAGNGPADVVLSGVAFAYGNDPPVLRGLDLEIAPGEVLAVVGPNGAGKTTLMKLLAGLDEPTAGRLTGPARDQVAVLFSDFVRYPLSLAENVMVSAPGTNDQSGVAEALALAGAENLATRLPSGLETPLSAQFEGGVDLSGGQWQKVALARAVYGVQHGRRLLIMDEPTAHLDAGQEADFYDRVVRTLSGTTIVLVSHRLSTVRSADRIVLLDQGRIAEQGTHAQLLALDGPYAAMFRLQAGRFAGAASGGTSSAGRREDGGPQE